MEKLCLRIEISFVPRGKKGFANLLNVNFVRKKIGSLREQYTSFLLVTLECCCLPEKLQKQGKFVAFFVYKIDEIPAIFFQTWETGAQPELAHAYYVHLTVILN